MFGESFFDVGTVATVMLHGRANMPTVSTMGGLGAATAWDFMNDNAGSGGTKGG